MTRRLRIPAGLGLALALVGAAPTPPAEEKDPQVGQTYKVPYRKTLTNHYLVRCRLNGKGPFNFLVDTGAPAVFVGTGAARAAGLKEEKDAFWTKVERLDIEGGATLRGMKVRIEDLFQLEGMNALGLPGAKIDGVLGFTALARFRMEFDATKDRMNWTRLDFEPKEPYTPRGAGAGDKPAEIQMLNALGPLMKMMAIFIGKQPEDVLRPRGLLGLELAEADGSLTVGGVLAESPAAEAGIEPGDRIVRVGDRAVDDLKAARAAVAAVKAGDRVAVEVRRGGESKRFTLTAAEGF